MGIRVLIIDRHAAFRQDLARFLRLLSGHYTIVGAFGTAAEALACITALQPDVVLTDVELPDRSGLVVAQETHRLWPEAKVIVMGDKIAAEYGQAALAAGAASYVDKLDLVRTLPPALHAATVGVAQKANSGCTG